MKEKTTLVNRIVCFQIYQIQNLRSLDWNRCHTKWNWQHTDKRTFRVDRTNRFVGKTANDATHWGVSLTAKPYHSIDPTQQMLQFICTLWKWVQPLSHHVHKLLCIWIATGHRKYAFWGHGSCYRVAINGVVARPILVVGSKSSLVHQVWAVQHQQNYSCLDLGPSLLKCKLG